MSKSKKLTGVSPLVATVLLIAIVVLVAAILMSWSTTLTKESQASISNRSAGVVGCTGAVIEIDSVYLDFSSNISRVYVRNAGQTNDVIKSVTMTNAKGESAPMINSSLLPISIPRAETKAIELNMSGKIQACANFSRVIVTSDCLSDTYTKAPTNCA